VEGSCEHGIEPPGSIKCWEVLEGLHNWRLLKKGSAPYVSKLTTYTITIDTKYVYSILMQCSFLRKDLRFTPVPKYVGQNQDKRC
jgi:hypothetical protein